MFIAPFYNELKVKKRVVVFFIVTIIPLTSYASIFKITVDAPIHPITSEYIRKTIDRAERENASLIIMAVYTPGGLDTSMREIIEKILASKIPVAIFVSPSGARADSAGFFIGIGTLALGYSPIVMFNVFLATILFSAIVGGASQFFYYRRGV